jgi:hypothetical protein
VEGEVVRVSIYATTVSFNADDHDPACARWVECSCDLKRSHAQLLIGLSGQHSRCDDTAPCICQCGPIIYQGSHILPADTDPRDGYFSLAEIPGHIERDGRGARDEDTPWPWLRASLNGEDVVLDHAQVVELHRYLGDWLERTEDGRE